MKAPIDIRSLARSHTAAAIRTLAGIMRQPKAPAAARVAAAQALLDRGWGKPKQAIDATVESRFANLSREELDARIREVAAQAGVAVSFLEDEAGDGSEGVH